MLNTNRKIYFVVLWMGVLAVTIACGTLRVGIVSSEGDSIATETTPAEDTVSLESTNTPNGSSVEPSPTGEEIDGPPETQAAPNDPVHAVAYIGRDGNVWVTRYPAGEDEQLTTDANGPSTDGTAADPMINYQLPEISSDGRYVAVRRDEGQPIAAGYDMSFSLMVYDRESSEAVQVFDRNPVGFAWKPGTHLLAYSQPIPEEYFAIRGEVDASLAQNIIGYDMDTGTSTILVTPERSYAMHTSDWSPDGRYLAFEEVTGYEGSGYFAYYDFESNTYHSWEEAIGLHTWSPDFVQIAYDRLTYTATGEERIFIRDLAGGEEQLLSVVVEPGYAFAPVFSPDGHRIAYLVYDGVSNVQVYDLYIQDLSGGDPLVVSGFNSTQPPVWSADGGTVFLGSGPYDSQQIIAVAAADGSTSVVADGSFPAVATISE